MAHGAGEAKHYYRQEGLGVAQSKCSEPCNSLIILGPNEIFAAELLVREQQLLYLLDRGRSRLRHGFRLEGEP